MFRAGGIDPSPLLCVLSYSDVSWGLSGLPLLAQCFPLAPPAGFLDPSVISCGVRLWWACTGHAGYLHFAFGHLAASCCSGKFAKYGARGSCAVCPLSSSADQPSKKWTLSDDAPVACCNRSFLLMGRFGQLYMCTGTGSGPVCCERQWPCLLPFCDNLLVPSSSPPMWSFWLLRGLYALSRE